MPREVLLTAPATRSVRISRHAIELAVAIIFGIVGLLSFLLDPETAALRSPIGRDLGAFAWAWAALYLAAAPLIVFGIVHCWNNVRLAGLLLLTAGLVMQGTAAIFGSLEPRSFAYYTYAAASGLRALYLFRVAERR